MARVERGNVVVSARLRARRARAGLAVGVVVALASGAARADDAAARARFKEGIERYDEGRYAEALVAFRGAHREKPSAAIKQNIALSLKGLGRLAEAAAAFDEALAEGKGTLKPETRVAIERELAELSKSVATVRLMVARDGSGPSAASAEPGMAVAVVPADAPSKAQTVVGDALDRPLRLRPGTYTLTAHAPEHADVPEKRLALVSGAPVDVTFVLRGEGGAAVASSGEPAAGQGELAVRVTNAADAVVRIDGVELPTRGGWTGRVAAGQHEIEASAPGWKTTKIAVTVAPGARVDQELRLQAAAEMPPEIGPQPQPLLERRAYLGVGVALDTVSYRLSPALDEPAPYGSRRSNFVGLTFDGRLGYRVARTFAVEGALEIGGLSAKYRLQPTDSLESQTKATHVQIMPMVRYAGTGKVRFTAATGFGVQRLAVETTLALPGSTASKSGSGVALAWAAEVGVQVEAASVVYFDLTAFMNVHGVGTVTDDGPREARLLYASPATRGGVRLGLGVPF